MKILIDINHPAHVHYFKNIIELLEARAHEFLIISRNKEIEHYLLNVHKIPFISRGKGQSSLAGKVVYFFKAILTLLFYVNKFKPEVIVSFGTPYPAIAGWLMGRPHISINDTEHAKAHHLLTDPFSKSILTPACYQKDLGPKHIRFDSYMELCYLRHNYFSPDPSVLDILGVTMDQDYVILRFVSWNAAHDIGHTGIDLEMKRKIVEALTKHVRVFISSEGELAEDLKKYQIKIPPEKMHDVLYYAALLYGESSTMASECACLGTPSIFLDNDGRGYTDEEEKKYGLVFNYSESLDDQNRSLQKAIEILNIPNRNAKFTKLQQALVDAKIDPTAYLSWFIENYPRSVQEIYNEQETSSRL
jgi:uncharacterized protein